MNGEKKGMVKMDTFRKGSQSYMAESSPREIAASIETDAHNVEAQAEVAEQARYGQTLAIAATGRETRSFVDFLSSFVEMVQGVIGAAGHDFLADAESHRTAQ